MLRQIYILVDKPIKNADICFCDSEGFKHDIVHQFADALYIMQPSQRKLKTILTQNFGGQKGAVWEMCEWRVLFRPRFSFHVAVTRLTFRTTKEKTH